VLCTPLSPHPLPSEGFVTGMHTEYFHGMSTRLVWAKNEVKISLQYST